MSNNLPQSPDSFGYDEDAYENIHKYFTKANYEISKALTVISGREFGRDWIVEVRNKDTKRVSGVEFYIQSKSTEDSLKDSYISKSLETKTINYLLNKTVCSFLHLYHRTDDVGYWVYLQEWAYLYSREHGTAWRKQETVTVRFPLTQKLSDDGVSTIMRIVNEHNRRSLQRDQVDKFNAYDPDFEASSPEFSEGNVLTTLNRKHDKAKFVLTTDEFSSDQMLKSFKNDFPARIPFTSSDFPNPFQLEMSENEEWSAILVPYSVLQPLDLNLDFMDANSESILSYSNVVFNIWAVGEKVKVYLGKPESASIYFWLVKTLDDELIKNSFRFFPSSLIDPIEVKSYFDVYTLLSRGEVAVVKDKLIPESVSIFPLPTLPPIPDVVLRTVNAAYSLKKLHGYDVKVPNQFDDKTLFHYEVANDLLTSKKSFWKLKPFDNLLKVRRVTLENIIASIKQNRFVQIKEEESLDFEVALSGIDIPLGKIKSNYYVAKLRNLEFLEQQLHASQDNDVIFELDCEIDFERSFTESQEKE